MVSRPLAGKKCPLLSLSGQFNEKERLLVKRNRKGLDQGKN